MKRINYIYGAFLFLALAFASCDKNNEELYNGNGNEEVNVPEGYVKVYFPGKSDVSTRAAINGSDTRIGHLQYLLYKKQADGNDYILEEGYPKTVFEGNRNQDTTWPYTQKISAFLPKGNEYKVVFLGNVDGSMFDTPPTNALLQNVIPGSSKYEEASIHLPNNGDFDDNNMYYLCSESFDTKEETTDGKSTMNVEILLQRIVSRNIIKKEGKGGTNGFTAKEYFKSLLEEGKPLGDKFLYGSDSYFASNLYYQFLEDIVYPIVYIMKSKGSEGKYWDSLSDQRKNDIDIWYNSFKPEEHYDDWTLVKANLDASSDRTPANAEYFRSTNTFNFICDLYDKNNSGELYQAFIESIREAEGYPTNKDRGFEDLKDAIAQSLAAQTGDEISDLSIWNNYESVKFTLNSIPQSVDFDLNVTYSDATENEQTIELTDGSTQGDDRYISFITLGDKTKDDGTKNFELSNKSLTMMRGEVEAHTVSLPETGFSAQPFLANTSTEHTLGIKDVTFKENSYTQDTENAAISVYFNIVKCILDAYFNGEKPEANTGNEQFTKYNDITSAADYVLHAVHNTMSEREDQTHASSMETEYWKLEFNTITFVEPEFSVTYEWKYPQQ